MMRTDFGGKCGINFSLSSGHRLLSAFRLSYPIKIIKVIIHKHKITKSKDKKICRYYLQLQNFGTEV